MSISPQSLARTRDKRSLRTPARYEDFSEVPPAREEPVRDRATTRELRREKEREQRELKEKEKQSERDSEREQKGREKEYENELEEEAKQSEKEKESDKTLDDRESEGEKSDKEQEKLDQGEDEASEQLSDRVVIKKELEKVDEQKAEQVERDKEQPQKESDKALKDIKPREKDSKDDKKREKDAKDPPRSSKKAKVLQGHSLIAKPTTQPGHSKDSPTRTNQVITNANIANNNQANISQVKYFNNMPAQQVHYGARFLLNEPVLLPRSVATIAPMTLSCSQVVNQMRRAPFVSKKAKRCLDFQDARKFDTLVRTHQIMVKIAKLLDTRDLLNLRLVSKSWKDIIDSDAIWQTVTLNKDTRVIHWKTFAHWILLKFRTKELILDGCIPVPNPKMMWALTKPGLNLKRLLVKSRNEVENRLAMELLCSLNSYSSSLAHSPDRRLPEIIWYVKICIDDSCSSLVPMDNFYINAGNERLGNKEPYCYKVEDPSISFIDTKTVPELWDVEELFNGKKYDLSRADEKVRPNIVVKPI